jgi:hypothetical protein
MNVAGRVVVAALAVLVIGFGVTMATVPRNHARSVAFPASVFASWIDVPPFDNWTQVEVDPTLPGCSKWKPSFLSSRNPAADSCPMKDKLVSTDPGYRQIEAPQTQRRIELIFGSGAVALLLIGLAVGARYRRASSRLA